MTEKPLGMARRVVVLADDLSGAAEVAGQFLGRDIPLVLQLNGFQPSWPGVAVVDLNTRTMSAQAAAERTRETLAEVASDVLVVKKIDSLLRGHIGPEVAVLAERGPVIVAAALPALDRTVRDGVLFVGDTPLRESGLWAAEPGLPPHSVAALFDGLDLDMRRIAICDAATDADLDDVVSGAAPGSQLVGTSALAAAVARTFPRTRSDTAERQASRSVLIAVGTAASVAADQVEALSADGVRVVTVDARALLHDKADAEQVQRALERGSAVVTIGGVVDHTERQAVSAAFGQFIAAAQDPCQPDLVLTGGETARAVVDAIGLTTLRPIYEIHHGAVASVASDGRRIVTRPGSFGGADSLVDIVRYLTQPSEDNS
jgi:4-hydroxythreonine-4-phosphate dehydrogenase